MHPPVRPAQPGDEVRIRTLQQYLSEPAPALLEAALDDRSTDTPSLAISVDRTWRLLVTPDETDEPVGYLLAFDGPSIHIAELVVAPACRREGRATALLAAVCGSGHPVTVCVAAANEAARVVYNQWGFTEVARHTEQFDSGDGLTLRYDPRK